MNPLSKLIIVPSVLGADRSWHYLSFWAQHGLNHWVIKYCPSGSRDLFKYDREHLVSQKSPRTLAKVSGSQAHATSMLLCQGTSAVTGLPPGEEMLVLHKQRSSLLTAATRVSLDSISPVAQVPKGQGIASSWLLSQCLLKPGMHKTPGRWLSINLQNQEVQLFPPQCVEERRAEERTHESQMRATSELVHEHRIALSVSALLFLSTSISSIVLFACK